MRSTDEAKQRIVEEAFQRGIPVSSARSQMDIVCGNDSQVIVDRGVDVAALRRVLAGLALQVQESLKRDPH